MDDQPSTPAKTAKTPKKTKTPTTTGKPTKKPEDKDLELAVLVFGHLYKNNQFPKMSWESITKHINAEAAAAGGDDEEVKGLTTNAVSLRWFSFRKRYGLDKMETEGKEKDGEGEGAAPVEKKRKPGKQGGSAKGPKQGKKGNVASDIATTALDAVGALVLTTADENDMTFEDAIRSAGNGES